VNSLDRASPETETCIYRVVQEATTNVARHARAGTCNVTIQQLSGSILVIVEDDGRGFDPEAHPRGTGLIGMSERVAGFGGKMGVESEPGTGTRITVELPVVVESGGRGASEAPAGGANLSAETGEFHVAHLAR
jgi:signal transduction histidine kinase